MKLVKGLLLKPTLNLLNRLLRSGGGNSLIIGGPLGWSWQATLDESHHGSLAGPTNAHRHSDLAGIGADDHHSRMHDHSLAGDGSPIALAGLPNLTQNKVWKGDGSNRPAESTLAGLATVSRFSTTLAGANGRYTPAQTGVFSCVGNVNVEIRVGSTTWYITSSSLPTATIACDGSNSRVENGNSVDQTIRCIMVYWSG